MALAGFIAGNAVTGIAMGAARFGLEKLNSAIDKRRRDSVAGIDEDVSGPAAKPVVHKGTPTCAMCEKKLKDANAKVDALTAKVAKLQTDLDYQRALTKAEAAARKELDKATKTNNQSLIDVWKEKLKSVNAQRAADAQLFDAKMKALQEGAPNAVVDAIKAMSDKLDSAREGMFREGVMPGSMDMINYIRQLASSFGMMPGMMQAMPQNYMPMAQTMVAPPQTVMIQQDTSSDMLDDGGMSAMLDL